MGMRHWRQREDKGRDKEAEAEPSKKFVQLCLLVPESVLSALSLTCPFIFIYLMDLCSFRLSICPVFSLSIKKKRKNI